MTSSNLTLHCGAFKATRDDLTSVITPRATSTWTPIPHTEIVDAVLESATNAGLTIKRELYGLYGKKDRAGYGARMFGVIDFLDGTSDYGYSVGFRNSHDKSMVAGICAGARVFVCDNLALAGDFAEKRRHTPGNNFIRLVQEAFTLLPGQLENLSKNLDRLKTEGISEQDAQRIIWRAATEGAIASSEMLPIWEEYKTPTFKEFTEPTKFNLLMSFTEKLKRQNSAVKVEQTYRRLADLFDL